ncbi:aldehyde dehydrogenase family protein [Gluconacetobacter diazotrophicus]|uniref:Aldehyde dehydrogenase family protein n=1 Tax=Gluconacetobacter diazotrophicus TaxID=33996 RepID=A0A7W4I7K0_GLUDI|nr:aldehyde dehydrogenase family protein [Gluconacetobacter diazotrophicus]
MRLTGLSHLPEQLRDISAIWASHSVADRLVVIRKFRLLLAGHSELIASKVQFRPLADTIASEILPLLDAARFLEREAHALLHPRRVGCKGRPLLLAGTRAVIQRRPLGAVLILAPSNYPLFLTGCQMLQAITAGNAVAVKPAPGQTGCVAALTELLSSAGVPPGLIRILEDTDSAGEAAVRAGFDHIILTGAASTGRRVARLAAETLTPMTLELSGNDAVFVLPGADLELVARSLAFGMRLNGGATCIAPHRVFIAETMAQDMEARLLRHLAKLRVPKPNPQVSSVLASLTVEAVAEGASARNIGGVTFLTNAKPHMALLRADVFAPWLALIPSRSMAEAVRSDLTCPYALGASLFGPEAACRKLASDLRAGSIVVNDLIAPTADPRLPFGGTGESGYGSTRGAEGLLALTRPVAISVRRGPWPRLHLRSPGSGDGRSLAGLARWLNFF